MSLPPPLPVSVGLLGPRQDFPTWLPAMIVKELRQGLRARGFVGVFIFFQLVMIGMFVWSFALAGDDSPASNSLNGLFWGLLSVYLIFVTPLRGLGALRDEIDAHAIDLLVLTRLKSWQIVLGKWTSLLAQASLLLVSVLPYTVVRYFFGAVNLVEDFSTIALMFGASGVLTAATLWCSSMPKVIRVVLLPVLLIVGVQGSFASMVLWGSMSRSGSSATSYGLSGGPSKFLGIMDCALLLVFFLHQAVRRLAPPAENHAFVARLLALTVTLSVPLIHFLGGRSDEKWQATVAFIVLMIISAAETAVPSVLLRVHWTRWLKWSGIRAALGRALLPGWPSAAAFSAAALALYCIETTLSGLHGDKSVAQNAWIAVHAWEALVFPAILISFLPVRSWFRARGVTYICLQALVGFIIAISTNRAVVYFLGPFASILDFVCHFLPISSFWLSIIADGKTTPSAALFGMQITMFIAIVVLFAYASRSYWIRLKTWQTAEEPGAVPTSSQSA